LGNKIIKSEKNDMGRAKNMGVISQKKEETQKENPQKTIENAKMNYCQNRPY
jgi:hypothetical protein